MEKFLAPAKASSQNPKPQRRNPWMRSITELNGRIEGKYRYDLSGLLMNSYSEIGAFRHLYQYNGLDCITHLNYLGDSMNQLCPVRRHGISALDFDSKGVHLASVTKSGCLTVHDFETLYCQSNDSLSGSTKDESKHVMHLPLLRKFTSVKWNPANQDEVYSKPVGVLQARHAGSTSGYGLPFGLFDLAFSTTHDSMVIASDTYGVLHVWDRRMGAFPCILLMSDDNKSINSIQAHVDKQIIFGAGDDGVVYMWDLRGGRSSASFQNHRVRHCPFATMEIALMLGRIRSLKAQSEIGPKEIHDISLNPSCPYQLAFHLDNGWSGVLDVLNNRVTHVHCPAPASINTDISYGLLYLRKSSWIPTSSIYVVGSLYGSGIDMLDFHPNCSSPSHVDFNGDIQNTSERNDQQKQNKFLPISESVTSCAVHPLNNTIIAGTKDSSLRVVSQRQVSSKADD